MNQAERPGRPRTEAPLVVVRQEFRLVGRHVDVHRTLALAALAREAQVEGFADPLVLPRAVDWIPFEHLPQQVRAPARRVHLLARHLKAGAHRPAVEAPAFADADAPLRRAREAAVLFRKTEMRRR